MCQRFAKSILYPVFALLLGIWFLFMPLLLWGQPAAAQTTWDESIPTTVYNGAPVPDWNNISFSSLPGVGGSGAFQIPDSLSSQLGYNPSRFWDENTPLDQVLILGDVEDGFGLQSFSLGNIAQIAGLNLNNISLDNFPLLSQQTISTLVQSIPNLATRTLNQVPILKDLVGLNLSNLSQSGLVDAALGSLNLRDYSNLSIGAIAENGLIGQSSLSVLDLKQYSLTAIPGLSKTAIGKLPGWQTTPIGQVPGLSQVPFSAFPKSPASGFFGYIALDDVTYGPAEHHTTPTKFSISGSDQVGFNYQCAQERGCAYLELNSPASLGVAGDPNLHGAQWIKGGTGPGGQMVKGGHGILGIINGGQEPTGRLPFGPVFKVVLTNTTESTGTGNFGLYFRVCHHGFVDLGCTPYFIGPVPWLSSHEKGIIFVGETQGAVPDNAPGAPPVPADVQQQIDALIAANEPSNLGDGFDGAVNIDKACLARIIAAVPSGLRSNASVSIPAVLQEAQHYGVTDPAQIAYILGTMETEEPFKPVEEGPDAFKLSGRAGNYFGRGFVQLTWRENYQKLGNRLGIDLVGHPELALDTTVAAKVIVLGMRDGLFSAGNKLGAFIHGSNHDYVRARHIVNDSDKAPETARQAERYLTALSGCTAITTASSGGNGKAGLATGKFVDPTPGNTRPGSRFGVSRGASDGVKAHSHQGQDFPAPHGAPIVAADGGRVIAAAMSGVGGYGSWIVVDNGNGTQEIYGHPSSIKVRVGDLVSQGQLLGGVGAEGDSHGDHLHFQVMQGAASGVPNSGHAVDPMLYLGSNRGHPYGSTHQF